MEHWLLPRHEGREPVQRSSVSREILWFALGSVAIACLSVFLIGGALHKPVAVKEPSVYRFDVELRSTGHLGSGVGTDVVISPDGTRVVFVAYGPDGIAHLNTRPLDETDVNQLPDTDGARSPFFSPDGRWVGFWANGQLKKVPIQGGAAVVLTDAPDLLGASWGDDGEIVAAMTRGGLWRVPSAGGSATPLVDLETERSIPAWPQRLPGRERLLFTTLGDLGADAGNIEVLSLADGKRTTLVRGGTFGRYVAGFLTFVKQGTLFAVALDLDRMETRGNAVAILNDVSYSPTAGHAQLDISRTGTFVYRRNEALRTPEQAQQAQDHVTFVLNFIDEVRRRIPYNG